MKILLIGSSGQLGQALISSSPKAIGDQAIYLTKGTRKEFDLSDFHSCKEAIKELSPDWVINSGAYTNVDKAEGEVDLAMRINRDGPRAIAEALNETGGKLIHISTDYVFSGEQGHPYKPYQKRSPKNVYGISKSEGERAIEESLFNTDQATIIRTSWLIGYMGNNFAISILKLLRERQFTDKELCIISDQVGAMTSVITLSNVIWRLILFRSKQYSMPSIMHWCDSGVCSWYDISLAVEDICLDLKLLSSRSNIIPITTEEYGSITPRPKYSLLDCNQTIKSLDVKPIHWRETLKEVLIKFRGFDSLNNH